MDIFRDAVKNNLKVTVKITNTGKVSGKKL
jgi:hypothetical protein